MSVTFNAANQAKLALKMRLSAHAWYRGSWVETDGDEYVVVVSVSKQDAATKREIPIQHDGVDVKTINSR